MGHTSGPSSIMAEMLPAHCDKMEGYNMEELAQDQEMHSYDRKDADSPEWIKKEDEKSENGGIYQQTGPLPPFIN